MSSITPISFDRFIAECLHPEAFRSLSVHDRMHAAMTGDAVPEHNTTDNIPTGTVLVFDTETGSLEIFGDALCNDSIDKYYDRERYIILGCLMRHSEWNRARILSPYFLKITIDSKEIKTGKQLVKNICSSVRDLTKWITAGIKKKDELSIGILDADDVTAVNAGLRVFSEQLDLVAGYAGATEQLSDVLRDQSVVYDDDGAVFLLGGFGPDYYAALLDCADFTKEYCAQSSYTKMSTEEFLARARGEEWTPDKTDESGDNPFHGETDYDETPATLNVRYNYKDFREQFPKVDVFEFWCPIVFSVRID